MPNTPTPRAFIRHPAAIPIEVAADLCAAPLEPTLIDVSEGGLACESAQPFAVGATVRITIPFVEPPFSAAARVVWCHPNGDGDGAAYDIGLQFGGHEDVFAARMVEQICHIEDYRSEVRRREGRELDGEAAALEWIRKYGADFPRPERH